MGTHCQNVDSAWSNSLPTKRILVTDAGGNQNANPNWQRFERLLPLVKGANIAIVILVFRGRGAEDEVQETWEYRTDRQQRGTWHDAVRWQDEHGQSGSGRHNAHGEASPGQGNQLHRYSGRL